MLTPTRSLGFRDAASTRPTTGRKMVCLVDVLRTTHLPAGRGDVLALVASMVTTRAVLAADLPELLHDVQGEATCWSGYAIRPTKAGSEWSCTTLVAVLLG